MVVSLELLVGKDWGQVSTYNLSTISSQPFVVVFTITKFAGSEIDNIMPTISYKSRHAPSRSSGNRKGDNFSTQPFNSSCWRVRVVRYE